MAITNEPFRFALLCSLIFSLSSCGNHKTEEATPPVVEEHFANGAYDRNVWKIDQNRNPGAQFELKEDSLGLLIPLNSMDDNPAEIKSRFQIDGDFEIVLDYTVESLPTSATESAKMEIGLSGPSGSASFRRTQNKGVPGFASWFQPSGEGAKIKYAFSPLDLTTEGKGQLNVKRTDGKVVFTATPKPGETPWEIGTIEYPSLVSNVQFRIMGKPTEKPIAVRFHDLRVSAGELWYGERTSKPKTTGGSNIGLISGVIAVLLVGSASVLLLRFRANN